MIMKTSRRLFLSSAAALAATAFAGAASAQDVIGDILKSVAPRQLGATSSTPTPARATRSPRTLPIFSPQTVVYVEQAIAQYASIVAQGGWPMVPATKKLKLGVDRSRRRGAAQAADDFGRPVDQRRHLARRSTPMSTRR